MIRMNYKICFVCTGNACRSPFAECVTKKLLADAGMSGIDFVLVCQYAENRIPLEHRNINVRYYHGVPCICNVCFNRHDETCFYS